MHEAEGYEKLNSVSRRDGDIFPKLLKAMNIDKNKKHFNILDFGSGTGAFASHFLAPFAEETDSQITCFDISEEMINFSKANYPHERVKYLACDIFSEDFPFKDHDSNFDYIFSFYVINFIKDYREVFRRLHRLLKPGGKFGFVTIVKHNEFIVDKLIGTDPKWTQYTHDYEKFIPEWIISGKDPSVCLRDAIESCGFKVIQLDCLDRVTHFDSMNAYAAFHHTILPFNGVIPKESHEDLKKSIRSYLCQIKGLPDTDQTYVKPISGEYKIVLSLIQK